MSIDYKDYYRILGITSEADSDAIKSAYRKMARIHHPDVNQDKAAATERFKDVNEAYTVLSDPTKRLRYDQLSSGFQGMRRDAASSSSARSSTSQSTRTSNRSSASGSATWSARPSAGQQARAGGGNARTANPNRGSGSDTGTIDPDDLERIFRGFGWAYSATRNRGATANDNATFSDFFEAVFGGLWGNVAVNDDSTEFRPGRDIQSDMEISLEEAFSGVVRPMNFSDGRRIEVSIPAGVATGAKLRVRNQGERFLGRPKGHLYVNINVKPHPHLVRTGDDLTAHITVDHKLAQRSGEVKVPGVQRQVILKIPAGTQTGQVFRLRGLGMPSLVDKGRRGDLLVEVIVKPPPEPRSGGPGPGAAAAAKPSRWREWLRNLLGVSLIAMGLAGLAAVGLSLGLTGWQLLAALGFLLIAHGVATREWLAGAGAVVVAISLGYAATVGADLRSVAQHMVPLLPLTLGYYLLASHHG